MKLLSGKLAWVVQRITALLMLVSIAAVLGYVLQATTIGYTEWKKLFANAHVTTLCVVVYTGLCLHAWVGARDVILDYAKPIVVRSVLLSLVAVLLFATSVRFTLILIAQLSR